MITHVVIFWTDKPHGEARDKLLAAARELSKIPGVLNYRCGTPVSSPRAVVDESYAVAISMDFENADTLASYQSHPEHQAFVRDFVKPNVGRFLVYDFSDNQ